MSLSYSAAELVEIVKLRKFQHPDELANILKWNILLVLIPSLTKEKAKTQMKNYSRLKTDSMLFMCIDTIINMFLTIVYNDDRENTDKQYVRTRTFGQLIRNKVQEFEDIQKEYDDLVEEKGFIQEKEHDAILKELTKEKNRLQEIADRNSNRLKEKEQLYKDKMELQEQRLRAKLRIEFMCEFNINPSDIHTPPEPS